MYLPHKATHNLCSGQAFLSAAQDAHPGRNPLNILGVHTESIKEAVDIRKWGTDYQIFAPLHSLNRPILNYNTQTNLDETFLGVNTLEQFAECFNSSEVDTLGHTIWCTNVHETLLSSRGISSLPHLPISIFNDSGYHWVAMLPISQSALPYMPVPKTRTLKE